MGREHLDRWIRSLLREVFVQGARLLEHLNFKYSESPAGRRSNVTFMSLVCAGHRARTPRKHRDGTGLTDIFYSVRRPARATDIFYSVRTRDLRPSPPGFEHNDGRTVLRQALDSIGHTHLKSKSQNSIRNRNDKQSKTYMHTCRFEVPFSYCSTQQIIELCRSTSSLFFSVGSFVVLELPPPTTTTSRESPGCQWVSAVGHETERQGVKQVSKA
jgi:hypothetical protein